MGMKYLMCEILCDEQKEIIKSLEILIKSKNEIILEKSKRANEMFKLSYNRKLKIEEQQAEIDRLKGRNMELFNDLNYIACGFCKTADEAIQHARKALNDESEEE
jgi:hypothetical protein